MIKSFGFNSYKNLSSVSLSVNFFSTLSCYSLHSLVSPVVHPAHKLFFMPLLFLNFPVIKIEREERSKFPIPSFKLGVLPPLIDWYHQLSTLYRAVPCLQSMNMRLSLVPLSAATCLECGLVFCGWKKNSLQGREMQWYVLNVCDRNSF